MSKRRSLPFYGNSQHYVNFRLHTKRQLQRTFTESRVAQNGKRVSLPCNNERPLDFIIKASFENVVRYMMATGGSTNSLLHIPAIACQAGIDINPHTFDEISRKIPVVSAIYLNHPKYTMKEFDEAGGILSVLHEMYVGGEIDETVKGMFVTIEKKAILGGPSKNKAVICSVSNPINQ